MSLDRFLPPSQVKTKQTSEMYVEERCANLKCRKIIHITDPRYELRVKGKVDIYCQTCAKKTLRPQENSEVNL